MEEGGCGGGETTTVVVAVGVGKGRGAARTGESGWGGRSLGQGREVKESGSGQGVGGHVSKAGFFSFFFTKKKITFNLSLSFVNGWQGSVLILRGVLT